MKKFGYWEDRAALLTFLSSALSSGIVFLVIVPQDSSAWLWLQEMTWFYPLKKRIVRSRQVKERKDDTIVTVVGDARIESISTSMIQDLWLSVLRCVRNHYPLPRQYTVNFINPNDMRAERQHAIIMKRIYSTTILIKYVEICKWRSLSILSIFFNTDENIRLDKKMVISLHKLSKKRCSIRTLLVRKESKKIGHRSRIRWSRYKRERQQSIYPDKHISDQNAQKYLSHKTEKVRGNVKTIREIMNFIRWRTEVEDTKRTVTENAHDNFEQKAIFKVFFILNNFECISSFVFLHREQRHDFHVWKKNDCFYILKKSSVIPRMLWRSSNLIVQFKWDTNLFKNMKKFGYREDRAALLTYMSSTLSSDIVFLVRFPQDLRSWIWL